MKPEDFCKKCNYTYPCKCLPETVDSPTLPVDNIVMPDYDRPCQATDPKELERQIMNSSVAKNEREWWAKQRIEELQDFAIWMTGCGYDFCQHEYFCKQRDKLLKA